MSTTAMPPLTKLPSTSTFSFTAPFPPPSDMSSGQSLSPHKQQRRVSLALPSSPRQFPAWSFRDDTSVGVGAAPPSGLVPEKKGKMRRIANDDDDSMTASTSARPQGPQIAGASTLASADMSKKQRRKWTDEETQMLVDGCQKWGVGNWKAILNDPELRFDNRSPVDLKDRFRTHFPDAYKHHYPNAKTHLSSKIRSTNTDGSPLFCAARSKKRRPFTPEEDAALKAGYDKHGTVWAAIVKDPIFQDQHRRSTDLRDRFRNAWPELYAKAGYKPRATAKKKKSEPEPATASEETVTPGPGSGMGMGVAVDTAQERPRAMPMRAATDDQLPTSSTMGGPVRRKRRHTTHGFGLFRGGTKSVPESMANSEDEDSCSEDEGPSAGLLDFAGPPSGESVDMEMEMVVPELLSSSTLSASDITESSQSQTWLDTPLHTWSSTSASTNQTNVNATPNPGYSDSLAASPTPSSDYILPQSPPGGTGMIGKSAWGPQDWLSPNPRLDTSGSTSGSFGNAVFSPSPVASPSPYSSQSQPLSLSHLSLNHLALQHSQGLSLGGYSYSHGVLDRYDLLPLSHDLDLDVDFVSEGFGGTGDAHSAFSDPSAWAGVSGMRGGGFTHHSSYAGDLIFGARTHQPVGHGQIDYGPGFGFGLGLEGVASQSVLHTPALPGIDEIELTNITLDDPREPEKDMVLQGSLESRATPPEGAGAAAVSSPAEGLSDTFTPLALEEIVGIPPSDGLDETSMGEDGHDEHEMGHITPPATPSTTYRISGRAQTLTGVHSRSISVPPSEHRAFLPPRPGQSQMVSPKVKHKALAMPSPFAPPIPPSIPQLPPQQASQPPAVGAMPYFFPHADAANYDLPFLDLHYYTNNDAGPSGLFPGSRPLGAQALDLAQTLAQSLAPGPPKQLCISPSMMELGHGGHGNSTTAVGHGRLSSVHHRGQSVAAVSPQDILSRKGNENKRKRASWDGGPR